MNPDIFAFIPEILLFLVPGYIALFVYRELRGLEQDRPFTTVIACSISYMCIALIRLVLSAFDIIEVAVYWQAIIATAILVICAICLAEIMKSKRTKLILNKLFRFSAARDTLSDVVDDKRGTGIVLRLKNTNYWICGTIISYGNTAKDPWIALRYVERYEEGSDEPCDKWEYEDESVIFNINDVEFAKLVPNHKNNTKEKG